MAIHLVPIAKAQFPGWLARCRKEYVTDLINSGESEQSANSQADASLGNAFPDDAPAANHFVFDLALADATIVGYLWVGPDNSGDPKSWWLWDVAVDAEHRGNGYGREAMLLAERQASSLGATSLGLSVFGGNATALKLYDSLGYQTTTIKMRKEL